MRSLLIVAASLVALASGCATKIYQGPTSGRAAEAQIVIAASADRAFGPLDVKTLAGKRLLVEVYGLTERLDRDSPEEAYVRSLLVEKLLSSGAQLAATLEDADVLVAVTLRSAGVDVIRRDFPFIYNHHTFRGLTSARVVAYNLTAGAGGAKVASKVLFSQKLEAEAIYREIYIFYVFGPIQQRN
jgi:hypothetical protein